MEKKIMVVRTCSESGEGVCVDDLETLKKRIENDLKKAGVEKEYAVLVIDGLTDISLLPIYK